VIDLKKSEALIAMTKTIAFAGRYNFKEGDIRPKYLLSVDLEDIRYQAKSGLNFPFRVPEMIEHILRFFDDNCIKGTFFAVGDTAREIGSLIQQVHKAGHELGCHTYDHLQLDKMTPETFRENLLRNMDALDRLGVDSVYGFRAPDFSLIESTQWAWEVLRELGFRYSSSVLPARNPLYGWHGFPAYPLRMDNGLWELPISITSIIGFKIPFAGGIYMRFFPKIALHQFCRKHLKRGSPLVGYIHPYDIDTGEKKFKVEKNPLLNKLVYYNRKSTFPKLEFLLKRYVPMRFLDYVQILEKNIEKSNCNA